MATQTQTIMTDDIDGGEALKTVSFSLEGINYEIDLSEGNISKLREVLDLYIVKGRKVKVGSVRVTRGRSSVSDRDQAKEIREWAKTQGIEVNTRGRISSTIVDQYNAAH